jgi:two-component system OmpR family response regulator
MVVDDNPSIVEVFIAMLRQGGYETISAGSGKEAISMLKKGKPDLILLDILMHPIDGWETLRRLKNDEKTAGIPVMMLTAKNPTAQEAEQYSSQIEDYIMKPITRRDLYAVIEEFFGRRREIDNEARKAEETGVDQQLVEEYRELCREIEIRRRLFRLLTRVHSLEGQDPSAREEIQKAIGGMDRVIDELETKLGHLRGEFAKKGENISFNGR